MRVQDFTSLPFLEHQHVLQSTLKVSPGEHLKLGLSSSFSDIVLILLPPSSIVGGDAVGRVVSTLYLGKNFWQNFSVDGVHDLNPFLVQ